MPDVNPPEPRHFQGVMVSSTFTDLKVHRKLLADALRKQKLFAVDMEDYSIKPDDDLISSSLAMVGEASAYIGLISHRYGQILDDPRNPNSYSISRLEFEEAQRLGRPTVIFIMGENHPGTKQDFDTDPEKLKKLAEYRDRATEKGRLYEVFENAEDFATKAVHAAANIASYLVDRQPKGRPSDRSVPSLIDEVCLFDEGQLVAAILDKRLTLEGLMAAIDGRVDSAMKIIRGLGAEHSGTWHRLLAAFVASRVAVPAAELITAGFELDVRWGARGAILALLRFTLESQGRLARDLVSQAAEEGSLPDMDRERLAIFSLGYLDGKTEIRSILEKHSALEFEYENSKLGSYAIKAFLHCYLETNNQGTERDALDEFTRTVQATERLGNLTLGLFDYRDELQCLRPGKATALLRHFRKHGHDVPLEALLAQLGHRPNPLLSSELMDLGRTSSNSRIAAGAFHAAAYTGNAQAETALVECAAQDLPGAQAAILLANGARRNQSATATIEAILADPKIPRDGSWLDDIRGNALWAAGELGREDRAFAQRVFDPLRHDPDDAYERGLALLGLAKAGSVLSIEEIDTAMDIAENFFERATVAIAGALSGWTHALSDGLRGMIDNGGPPYRLVAHLARDLKIALRDHAGEEGKALVTLLKMGDLR